jgi:hypothetical protein
VVVGVDRRVSSRYHRCLGYAASKVEPGGEGCRRNNTARNTEGGVA